MKIHQIIKEKRLVLGLTQEQLADCLGVSTPAVNKWEKGVSYPDITLLPPLARLLKVDLNTLLSFEEDLSDQELVRFANEVASTLSTEDFPTGFEKGMDLIHKYPTCHKLILNLAIVLQGSLYLYAPNEAPTYAEKIEQLYERCLESDDQGIRYQAISMLATNSMNTKQFEKAQTFLDQIPNIQFDKKQQQGLLFIQRKDLDSALKLFESELMTSANKINAILLTMIEIALMENRSEDALYFADIAAKSVALFDLWDYVAVANYFVLYKEQKDTEHCVKTLRDMLRAIEKPWEFSKSKLYTHIDKNSSSSEGHQTLVDSVIKMLITDQDGELDFIQNNPDFKSLMQKYTSN